MVTVGAGEKEMRDDSLTVTREKAGRGSGLVISAALMMIWYKGSMLSMQFPPNISASLFRFHEYLSIFFCLLSNTDSKYAHLDI